MYLVPYAVIHIGVSIALAANLILVYRRIHRADFLIYWAAFWLCVASVLGVSQVATPLLANSPGLAHLMTTLTISMVLTFPVLMICAGLSIGGLIRQRTAWLCLGLALALGGALGLWQYFFRQQDVINAIGRSRPMLTALSLVFFTYQLAVKGRREAGSSHTALVGLSVLYCVHNFLLALSPFGVRFYPNGSYSPWAAVIGIMLEFALTMVFSYAAIERTDEATSEAREAGRRLRALLETVGIAGIILGRNERVEFCNAWLAEALGLPSESIIGRSWLDSFVPARERESVRQVFEAGFNTGQWPAIHEYSLECRPERKPELCWYHTSLRDVSGAIIGVASLGIDQGQQKRLEAQVEQARKMETLGRLAGGVAHDFNNYLTVINGYADLLLDRFPGDDPTRADLMHIRNSARLAATLTRQLLTFGRRHGVALQQVSVNDTVKRGVAILRRLIRENVELETDLTRTDDFILTDPGQLDHVLLNLVLNANDAIIGSGIITIRTRRFTGIRPEASPNGAEATGEFSVLEVEDTGAGMDEWTRRRVFEPFFTTKAEGGGTGLGLSTVHGAVTQAGGWIDVRSQLGKGSVFSVYLPRVETPMKAPARIPAKIGKDMSGSTVLVVEDQDTVRKFTVAALERSGHRVIEASTAAEALRIASDPNLYIAVLVTDMVMPGVSGDELAHRLREIRPGLATLFVSGYTFDHEADLRDPVAPSAFLGKPYTAEELCAQVDRLALRTPGQPRLN
jgi:two-component system cell cycle sensor histidine kinase/response regulator CckA